MFDGRTLRALVAVLLAACAYAAPATVALSADARDSSAHVVVLAGPDEIDPAPGDPSTAAPLPRSRSCGAMTSSYGAIYASHVSVRRISCRRAKRVLGRTPVGQHAPPGWRCRTVGQVYEGSTQRCTRRKQAMQFDAGV